jgi:3-isopropylmalate dehydrogenase
MMLRYGLNQPEAADRIETAVLSVLDQGYRTGDIMAAGMTLVGCKAMGEALLKTLE